MAAPDGAPAARTPARSGSRTATWLARVGLAAALLIACAGPLAARDDPTAALDPNLEWQIARVRIEGNERISDRALFDVIETRPRRRLLFWQKRPIFERVVFDGDLDRVARVYEAEGYYRVDVRWRVESRRRKTAEHLSLVIEIEEGPRAVVGTIEIDPPDDHLVPSDDGSTRRGSFGRPRPRDWALSVGDPFREIDYQRLEAQLRAAWLDRGHASVTTTRKARVRPDRERVDLRYEIVPGPTARFGPIDVEGLERVAESLVRRELVFETGDPFSLSRIELSRRRLQDLDLFASIEIDWQVDPADPGVAAIRIALHEKKFRELRVGGGYSTEEQGRAHVRWQNRNFLGGGRRMLVSGRYSSIVRAAEVSFVQPHLFDHQNRGLFEFGLFQQDEPNFTRNSIQGLPAFARDVSPTFQANAGFRVETAEVRDVEEEVRLRIGGVRSEGTVIGPRLWLRWSPIDDLARPTDGFVATFETQYSTRAFGATYDYVRLVGEISAFQPVFDWAVVAARLKVGAAQAFGGKERLPIFERFYAGGEGSVRGYRRRQLGPTADNGNPLGGRSLIEGSLEARIPVWGNFGAVGFVDFGQVSLARWDFVPDDLRFAAGPGVSYSTPIGPISLFAGFPINRQEGESPWQIHFNIGFFF